MRLVMVPLETRVCGSSAFGLAWNGGPSRRRAASTSNSHGSSPELAKASRRARSRCFASRATRESTCRGEKSSPGCARCHAATMRSTSPFSGICPLLRVTVPSPTSARIGCMPIPVILDVDTGVDDALALLFAAAHPELDLIGVSCVAGNAPLPKVVENTLRVLALAGATDVPVAAGAHRPLIESPRDASHVHGADGLAGVELPPAARAAEPDGAVAFLRRRILDSPEPVTLVALAPQTNLALLL